MQNEIAKLSGSEIMSMGKAFAESGNEAIELSDLALRLAETSNVKVRPPTILSLCQKIEAEIGYTLLTEAAGYDPPRYVLNKC